MEQATEKFSGKAITAFVLGLVSWFVFPFIPAVAGLFFAISAKSDFPGCQGKALNSWGQWLSIANIVFWGFLLTIALAVGVST